MQEALRQVAHAISSKYDCGVALAYRAADGTSATAAAGHSDHGLGVGPSTRLVEADDSFVWGSTTKMFTGAAVLQLVQSGAVSLDDPIAKGNLLQRLAGV